MLLGLAVVAPSPRAVGGAWLVEGKAEDPGRVGAQAGESGQGAGHGIQAPLIFFI